MTKLQQKFNFLSFYSSLKNFQKERVDSPSSFSELAFPAKGNLFNVFFRFRRDHVHNDSDKYFNGKCYT